MTQKVKLLLAGIAIVVFAAVVWFLVLSPIRGDITETEEAMEAERNLISRANTELLQAEVTRTEGMRNQMRLLELAKMVPMTEELPSLLLQIQDLADQAGIEFIQVTPGEATASDGSDFQIIPLSLEFSGTYFDIQDFIYRAEHMVAGPGRLLAIKTVTLGLGAETAGGAGTSPGLDVSMGVYAFMVGGGSPIPATGAPPASDTGGDSGSTSGTEDGATAQ